MDLPAIAALSIHDVKNRLASCAGRAEAVGDRQTRDELLAAARELSRLLLLFKAENGLLRPQIDAHSPAELLEDLLAEQPPGAGLEVSLDLASAPPLAYYDAHLIGLLLSHALDNARRHARRLIRLGAQRGADPRWLIFYVEDDGPGFPAAQLDAAAPAAAASAQGTGLGLHLSRHIAALHQLASPAGPLHGQLRLSNPAGARLELLLPG